MRLAPPNTSLTPGTGWLLSGPQEVRSHDSQEFTGQGGWAVSSVALCDIPVTSSVSHLSPYGLGTIAETRLFIHFMLQLSEPSTCSSWVFRASGYQVLPRAQTPTLWPKLPHLI